MASLTPITAIGILPSITPFNTCILDCSNDTLFGNLNYEAIWPFRKGPLPGCSFGYGRRGWNSSMN